MTGRRLSPICDRQYSTRGGTSGRVRQQVQALVYTLNRKLQRAYIDANLEYVKLLLHGGDGHFLGERFNVNAPTA